jgi:hypothetical protein
MYNKKVSIESAVTQTTAAVVSLLEYLGKPANPLPAVIELPGMVLVLGNKKDAYYTTSEKCCSCPAAGYHPGQKCKHQRRYFPGAGAAGLKMAETQDSIRPAGKWPGGFNGPVDLEGIKAKTEPTKMGA